MARHAASQVWLTQQLGTYPNCQVSTADESSIEVAFFDGAPEGYAVRLTRSHARLLARRINACLDATKS